MEELPQLHPTAVRKLAVQREELLEKHGFTGEHLKWHEAERKRKSQLSKAPRPIGVTEDEHAWRREMHLAKVEPAVAQVGISQTTELAKERFGQLAGEHFTFWAEEDVPNSDVFAARLGQIRLMVSQEIAALWQQGEWHSKWFKDVCRPKLEGELQLLVKQWVAGARKVEVLHLETSRLKAKVIESKVQIHALDAKLKAFDAQPTSEAAQSQDKAPQPQPEPGVNSKGSAKVCKKIARLTLGVGFLVLSLIDWIGRLETIKQIGLAIKPLFSIGWGIWVDPILLILGFSVIWLEIRKKT